MSELSPDASDKLWGSRFKKSLSLAALSYTETTSVDQRMLVHDIWGSIAHNVMLSECGIVTLEHAKPILSTLLGLLARAETGEWKLDPRYEDVHLNVETLVIEKLGVDVGGRMHTARSRNDQVVTDSRLYLREAILDMVLRVTDLAQSMLSRARHELGTIVLGYTHSQVAQPISLGFWLSSHASSLLRDASRLRHGYWTINQSPLGAGALAGTSFSIDRRRTADLLAFDTLLVHALDATSARDFVLEFASCLALIGTSLSRLCEELVLWSGSEFRLLDLGDELSTGSSIMPQKKNPVVAELARARSGVAVGALAELLTVVKSVSLGYSCDLQQDKPALWRSIDSCTVTLDILRDQVNALAIRPDYSLESYWSGHAGATELANNFVVESGKSFREAYKIVGDLVRDLDSAGSTLRDADRVIRFLAGRGIPMSVVRLQEIVDPHRVVERQISEGSTGPKAQESLIGNLESEVCEFQSWAEEKRKTIASARDRCLQAAKERIG